METFFRNLSNKILNHLKSNEELMINFWGENSHFTRFNQSKVRQNGFVSDVTLSITLIFNNRTCSASFSLSNHDKEDLEKALSYLDSLRNDIVKLPKDTSSGYEKLFKSLTGNYYKNYGFSSPTSNPSEISTSYDLVSSATT